MSWICGSTATTGSCSSTTAHTSPLAPSCWPPVLGAGNSAGQAAVHLARYADRVSMIVRGGSLAASNSDYLAKTIGATGNIDVRLHTTIVDGHGTGRLEHLVLRDGFTGQVRTIAADGYILTGDDLRRAGRTTTPTRGPLPLETSMPGVFAAGDVRHGSVKRVASAVGDGGVTVRSIHEHLSATA